MAFAISTRHLPCLHDYDEAKERYNSVIPIRGKAPDIRPLGKRSAQHMRIEKNNNEHGEYYAATLYSTECVRYYADGRIQVQHGNWPSQSTAAFINRVSPFNACLSHTRLWVNGEALVGGGDSLWFDTVEDQRMGWRVGKCMNPRKYFTMHYNKATTQAIRSNPIVKHMQRYLKTMKAMGAYDNLITAWGAKTYDSTREALAQIMRDRDQNPDNADLLPVLAQIGDVMLGPVPLDTIYKAAVTSGWVTEDELYIKTEAMGNDRYRRGVIVE